MTTGGQDPNQYPPEGNPQAGGTPPPPGGYPPPPGNYPPQGGYPPPPGNYPPQGGYPPPPGNYPPQGGYPTPPPAFDAGYNPNTELRVGEAISYSWRKFSGNVGVWVGLVVVAAIIQLALSFLFNQNDSSAFTIIGTIVTTIVAYLIQASFVRGALHEVDGNKPPFGSFFQFTNVGAIIVACFLVGVLTAIGFVLLIIPGLILVFLTWWTLQFVIDQNQDPIGAIKSSFKAIASNWGTLLVLALALVGLNILGAIPVGLGLLVTIPMTIIASTYAYRVTIGGRVAP